MKQIGILLVGILLIANMMGGVIGEIFVDTRTNLLTLETTNSRSALAADMARDPEFMETNWNHASENQKSEYMNKRHDTTFKGESKGNKLTESGDLVNKDGKVLITNDELKKNPQATVRFETNGEIILDKFSGTDQPGALRFDSKGGRFLVNPSSVSPVAPSPVSPTTAGTSPCGPSGCNFPLGNGNNVAKGAQVGAAIGGGLGGPIGQGVGAATGAIAGSALEQAPQYAMQFAQQAATLLGPFFEQKKQEGQNQGEQERTGIDSSEGLGKIQARLLASGGDIAIVGNKLSLDGPNTVASFQKGTETFRVAPLDGSQQATAEAQGNSIIGENIAFIKPEELAGEANSVTLTPQGIQGSSNTFPASTTLNQDERLSLSPTATFIESIKKLFPLESLITGKAIANPGQSITLRDHDLIVNGHDMNLYSLKTFNNIEIGGNNLNLYNGNIHLQFNGQKIMYSRLITNAPFGIKRVSNKLDINQNRYILQHYEENLGEFYDEKRTISIGDITTSPGPGPYARLLINSNRFKMFQN